jgi:FkbM family methyltransferase
LNDCVKKVTLNAFSNVTIVNAAVADKRGRLTLYGSTLSESPEDPEANNLFGGGDYSIEVATVSLDDDLADRGVQKVDLLKIDVEGAEPLVLAGAEKLLRQTAAPTILIEVNPVSLRSASYVPAVILNWLQSHGYNLHELEQFMYKGETVVNILATPVK